jgi:hypothetical protein
LLILGPILWVAALVVVAYVVREGRSVGIALLVLAGSLLLAMVTLLLGRWRRVRNERRP